MNSTSLPSDTAGDPRWHALPIDEVERLSGTDRHRGLSSDEAAARLGRDGPNALAAKPVRPAWLAFLDQFKSVLVGVLGFAAVLSLFLGDALDAGVILVVVLLNAAFGFYQERRASRSMAALARMLPARATVRRDGRDIAIDADGLVRGDVVVLTAGDKVPADARVVASARLEIDESALTGESHAASKHASAGIAPDAPLAERPNVAFMNTVVTRGRAELIVVETGMRTEIGRVAQSMYDAPERPSPLQVQLDRLGRRLLIVTASLAPLLLGLAIARGEPIPQAVLATITLAVAAIPEGLPAVVTVTLALGMRRMAKRRAIVKRLAAVETLGCVTTICTDKTGTLTLNQMTVRALFARGERCRVTGEGYSTEGGILRASGAPVVDPSALLRPAVLCNDARLGQAGAVGDPTELALLVLAAKGGADAEALVARHPRLSEVPFESAARIMATLHRDGDAALLCVKGSPHAVLERCATISTAEGDAPLDAAARREIDAENEAMAHDGLRVLAIASRALPGRAAGDDAASHMASLTFQGLVGIADPPRPSARDAIARCKAAGIGVKMITGDQVATAAAIARELGLEGRTVAGASLDGLDDAQIVALTRDVAAIGRVTPEHKVALVRALQSTGEVVAMTGDGVNDAPALRRADIGVAMGIAGVEVSKEAATMVLADDNFATIVRAVEEGRAIYDNIVKFVRFQVGTNIGAIGTVVGAALVGLPVPFNPIQILWVNMIMDGPPAMALGVDPPRRDIMSDPPRSRDAEILTWRRLARIGLLGATMAAGTLTVYAWALRGGDAARATTMAFTTFVLMQAFNLFNARAERASAFRDAFSNGSLWLALGAVLAVQFAVVHWAPARTVFHTVPLGAAEWGLAAAVAAGVLAVEEARKAIVSKVLRRRSRRPAATA